MSKLEYDFDKVIDRKNTNCLKYDSAVKRGKPADILPLWVADMDFEVPKEVKEAVIKRAEHGIFGYSEDRTDSYFEAVRDWMKEKHDWEIEEKWLVKTPGVVYALAMAIRAFSGKGDAILVQQPVYYPFQEVIEDNDRKLVNNPLVLDESGKYQIDFKDFETKIEENDVKIFFLCNPQNPTGRVFSKEELERLGEICLQHQVLVVSDEIHQDFVYRGKHTVFANLGEKFRDNSIICTAPSKTFNIAGLQVSNIFIANPKLRAKFRKEIAATGYSQLNVLGLTACEAAYRYGSAWHEELLAYLKGNIEFIRSFIKERLPEIRFIEPEGTYLAWFDFRSLSLTEREREDMIVNKAGLWLDRGEMFGPGGEGFERINIACPRSILNQAFVQLEEAIHNG